MSQIFTEIVKKTGEEYRNRIQKGSRFYMEVNMGKQADKFGLSGYRGQYENIFAIIPLKQPVKGMKVRIDGRTFVNYIQVESGIAIPGNMAKKVNLTYETFIPNDSMILNFT